MIDRDYKVVDGLYKYSDSDNDISSVFISRDEIYSIILNKYIYARLVFKYKTDIGNDITSAIKQRSINAIKKP